MVSIRPKEVVKMVEETYSGQYYSDWYALTFEHQGGGASGSGADIGDDNGYYAESETEGVDDDMDFYDGEIRSEMGDNDELDLRESGFMEGYAES